ncbi:MAG: carboxypeptidase-like regulatory domain-containing protein [Pseudomonadota bacterium]
MMTRIKLPNRHLRIGDPIVARGRRALVGALLASLAGASSAATLQGRVFDAMEGVIYAGAEVELLTETPRKVVTDDLGAYRFENVEPGPYLVRVRLKNGDEITARLVVTTAEATLQHLDLSKIANPHDDHGY